MADPAPEKKADPVAAQYVISITPEQYESHLKQAAIPREPPPPRPQMEMGGSGTAKVGLKDAAGGDVAVTGAEWSATGPITVTADEADPTSAKITPTGLGPATVTATASTATGSVQAHAEVMVIEKIGAPVSGTIEITVAPPVPPEPPVEPPPVA